jgi:hypothetical protein
MKKITLLVTLLCSALTSAQEVLITGYVDATCSNADGRVLELYVNGTLDLTGWKVQRQSNGGGFTTDIDLSTFGTIANDYIYLTNNAAIFTAEFSITQNILETGSINSNGDDAFQIVDDQDAVIDRFGEENVDGTGTAWEHTDSFYLRNDFEAANGGSFNPSNWTFAALDALDGEGLCNAANAYSTLVPLGSFQPTVSVVAAIEFEEAYAAVSEDGTAITIQIEISEAPTATATVDVALRPVGTAQEGIHFTFSTAQTVTFPAGSTANRSVTIPLIDNLSDDPDLFFVVELVNAQGASIGDEDIFSVYILDDDTEVPTGNTAPLGVAYLSSYLVDSNGTAEITAYDPDTQRLFVTNESRVEVLDFSDPSSITPLATINIADFGGEAIQSIAVKNGIVAGAVSVDPKTDNGFVILSDADGNNPVLLQVGALPDMLTFTPDGSKLVVANEGEPNDDYTVDPLGSISIIDVSGGLMAIDQGDVTTLDFTSFNSQEAALIAAGVRIYGPGASVAQDLEPEYIAVSTDSQTAYVTLQENNAYAIVDLVEMTITDVLPFGLKDHSLPQNSLDVSDETDFIFNASWPVKGMYMPDAIAYYEVNGTAYVVTANEGDAREYDTYEEERKIDDSDYVLDPAVFSDIDILELESNLGEIAVTNASGDINMDGLFEEIHIFGGRSFSIFEANTATLLYDSGNDFEVITAADPIYGAIFNASNSNNNLKNRSDNKGPEPEGVIVEEINGSHYAFVLLERIGGIMIYDVSNPASPQFLQYVNNRDATPGGDEMGDLGPEGIVYVPIEESPNGKALLVVANEVSATLSVYTMENVILSTPSITSPKDSFTMYPNPAQNTLYFGTPDTYTLYDNLGRLVVKKANAATIDITSLSSGMYFVQNTAGTVQKLLVD